MVDSASHNCHWEFIIPVGDTFTPRGRHCIASMGFRIFILGGNSDSSDEVVDVWCMSIVGQSHSWKRLSCMGDMPSQRTCASIVCFDEYANKPCM